MPRFEPHPERRAAVVTGASSGHGLATAQALAAAGHPVVLGARRLDRLEEAAAKIVADGGEAIGVALDLTDDASIDAFAAAAEERLGPIEIVVSNAGEVLPATALGMAPEDFARQVQVNLLGAHRLLHRLGPPMVERRRGDIVFVTSDVVRVPRTYMAAYVTSKHALEGLARAMQMELEGSGVRVGIVRPGPSTTEQGAAWDAAVIEEVLADWGRWGIMRHPGYLRPADVARAVLTVVSTPRGTHLTLVEVEPEAPVGGAP
jgi:NAD(P)-dependent dehydrogenase (short-subunit alcohol dehydrogenase family)